MTDRFGNHARRLAGAAGRLLGWPPHWFWRATPSEFAAIFETPEDQQAGMTRAQLDQLLEQERHG